MEENKKQETQHFSAFSLIKSILGGDFLGHEFFKRQIGLLILIVALTIWYIDNRYSSQQEMLEIDRLKKQLVTARYDALTISSEVTMRSRQSRIEDYIVREGTPLETSTRPPYRLKNEKK